MIERARGLILSLGIDGRSDRARGVGIEAEPIDALTPEMVYLNTVRKVATSMTKRSLGEAGTWDDPREAISPIQIVAAVYHDLNAGRVQQESSFVNFNELLRAYCESHVTQAASIYMQAFVAVERMK